MGEGMGTGTGTRVPAGFARGHRRSDVPGPRLRRTAWALLMTIALAACGGGGSGPAEPVVSGPEPTLSTLSLSLGSLDQPFQASQRSYTASQPHLVAELQLLIDAPETEKRVRVAGREITPGELSEPLPLGVGSNLIEIEVERSDPPAIGTYRLDVERLPPESVVTTAELREGDGLPAGSRQVRMAFDGDRLAVTTGTGSDPVRLEVRVFRREGEVWVEEAVLPAPDPDRPAGFGSALALHDDVLVVGVPFHDNQASEEESDVPPLSGAAYVYRRQGETWALEATLFPPDPHWQQFFGRSMAVHGTQLAVGASFETVIDDGAERLLAGAIYVYARDEGTWQLTTRITAPEPVPGAFFGDSLALDATTLIATAPREGAGLPQPCIAPTPSFADCPGSEGPGALYVYALTDGGMADPIRLDSAETGESGRLGTMLAYDGQRIAALAPLAEPSGVIVLWRRTADGWMREAVLRPAPETTLPVIGSALDMAQGVLALGFPLHDDGATGFDATPTGLVVPENGAVLLFERSGATWMGPTLVKPPEALERQRFGEAVALEAGRLVISQQPLAGARTFPVTTEAEQALFFMK